MNFNFKPVKINKHKENVSSIFQRKVTGIVIEEYIDETFFYFVLVGEIKYPVSKDSYETKKKKIVYFKDNNRWACVIRLVKEDRCAMPQQYLPFRPKYEVVGDIIVENMKHVFKIKGCYKPDSAQKVEILKEIENEEECQV